jgi:hypothetical protein
MHGKNHGKRTMARGHIRSSQLHTDSPRLTEADHTGSDIIQGLAETDAFRFDMVPERVDMQFVNHHVLIHSRTRFEDFDEPGRKRHLLWLSIPDGRPLSEGFRDAYKSVERNTVRGGFKGRQVGPELRAYQARAAAALEMRDRPYWKGPRSWAIRRCAMFCARPAS